jgi:hypothetical protein
MWCAPGRVLLGASGDTVTGKVELGDRDHDRHPADRRRELDVAFEKTALLQGVTGQTVDQGYTAGSQTIRTQWASGLQLAHSRTFVANFPAVGLPLGDVDRRAARWLARLLDVGPTRVVLRDLVGQLAVIWEQPYPAAAAQARAWASGPAPQTRPGTSPGSRPW